MIKKRKLSYLFIFGAAIAFGTMEVALKIGGGDFSALQMTFLRFLIGGLVLLPFAISDMRKRGCRLESGDWLYLLFLGVVNTCFSMTMFQIGVMQTNAGLAAIMISTNPVFTMVFAHFLTIDTFTKRKAGVLILSLMGLLLVANPSSFKNGENMMIGVLILLAASISFGFYSAYGKRRIEKIGGLAQNSLSFLLGSVVEFFILLTMGEPVFAGINQNTIGILLYIGFVVTGFGYVCYMKAIELAGPSTASITFFIKPPVAVCLAALLLKESITWNMVGGIALISFGFLYNLRGEKEKREK